MGFLDHATGAIKKASRNAADKANGMVEVSKYTSAIEECEQRIRDAYEKIGQQYYEQQPESMDEQYIEWFDIVIENKLAIKKLYEKIRILKGIEICPNCGAELKKGVNFCNLCGMRVLQYTENDQMQLHCLNCGASLKGNEKFCAKCGAEIAKMQLREPEQQKLICKGCGKELNLGNVFCPYCGMQVAQEKQREE